MIRIERREERRINGRIDEIDRYGYSLAILSSYNNTEIKFHYIPGGIELNFQGDIWRIISHERSDQYALKYVGIFGGAFS